MLFNSVAKKWLTPDKTAITGGVAQDYTITTDLPGLMSVLIMADVDIHISKGAGTATTNKFLLLANTYMEIPVGDLDAFSFWGTGAGSLYVIEWGD